jgi:transcriptional regulator with XRE-family HTH domain
MSGGTYSPCERFRRARGWSQVRLAGVAGCGTALVMAIEQGRVAKLRIETVVRVARALGVSVVDLVPGLAVRESAGGRVQESGGSKRAYGRARGELIRRGIVEVLRSRGGSALGEDVVCALVERYGVSRRAVVVERRGMAEVEAEQLRGVRPGLAAWEWRLVSPAASASTAQGPAGPSSPH